MKVTSFFKNQPRLNHIELLLFTKYLSVLLRSGLPLDESLEILQKQANNKKSSLSVILINLTSFIRTGKTLADGMNQYSKTFSPVYINLIKAGEASGTLKDNLDHLSRQLQKERELTQKVRGAMMYPAVIMTAGLVIAVGIVVFILPQITSLFVSLKIELPLTTKIIFWVSDFIRFQWFWIISFLAFLFVFFNVSYRLKKIKPLYHSFYLFLPILGKLFRNVNLARSFRLTGTLLKSGLPISDTLEVVVQTAHNLRYQEMFSEVKEGISRGGTFTTILEEHAFLVPPIAQRLILVGEETGTLSEMLLYLAEFYEEEVDDLTKNLTALLEPLMIIFIGITIGWLAISILTPIYKVVGSI